MTTANVTIYNIKHKLSRVPENKLQEVADFIEFILIKSKAASPNIVKFEGIWKGLGFEKIADIESNIRQIRKEAAG